MKITLGRGRERPVLNGHPWVFSGAVEQTEPGDPEPGSPCEIYSHDGAWLANGYVNPRSQIFCRVVSRDRGRQWDKSLVELRLDQALSFRERIRPESTDALRLVNAEGDLLPGVVVDRYGPGLVIQLNTAGADCLREPLTALLTEKASPEFIYENSTGPARAEEHLAPVRQSLLGQPPDLVTILEHGHRFLVDVTGGQKTGFYLDQRENRRMAARWTARGAGVLNLFAYTGSFSVYTAGAGAERVVSVESSREALDLAGKNLAAAGLDPSKHPLVRANVSEYLRTDKEQYDLIVLDPPPLARRSSHLEKAARAYKDLNRLAIARLTDSGILLTFTCSSHVGEKLFRQIVFSAALEADRTLQVIAILGPGPDHPTSIFHPEGSYLTGLLLRACG